MVARSWYIKGKSFVGAAILLRQKGGYEYVVLHLLCQGIEIVLKAILLATDYDKYKPRLKTVKRRKQKIAGINHNLVKAWRAVAVALTLSPLRPPLRDELRALSELYSRHLLRYGSLYDILVDPATIGSDRIVRRLAALLRLAEKKRIFA